MSTQYKYQESFAAALAKSWVDGKHDYVRTTIRGLKNKAQAAFIAAEICRHLQPNVAYIFCEYLHPNNGRS